MLLIIITLTGCGGRTGLAPIQLQRDGGVPGADRGTMLDRATPQDRAARDACQSLTTAQVKGLYMGTWKGTWTCTGLKAESAGGLLFLTLIPAGSPGIFDVGGVLYDSPQMGLAGPIDGTMVCTTLAARAVVLTPEVQGARWGVAGTLKGILSAKAGGAHGFINGTWQAKNEKPICTASGTWEASYSGP